MADLLPASLDYSAKDFGALKVRLRNLIRSVFPDWTDESFGGMGNLLVELFAHVGDVVSGYQDRQALETRLATAVQRRNVIALVKMLGYRLGTAKAAQANVQVQVRAPHATLVLLPPDPLVPSLRNATRARTRGASGLTYQLVAPVTIPANPVAGAVSTATLLMEHAESVFDQSVSTGKPDQTVALSRTPYIDGSLAVTDSVGAWAEVDNLLLSGPTDRHYAVDVDQNDRATLTFGNGVLGVVPVGIIRAVYKVGGGKVGNVAAATITQMVGSYADSLGAPVQPMPSNAAAATGGDDRESVTHARANAPLQLRATKRTVAREDFEAHALLVAGVGRALLLTRNEDIRVEENTGHLYVVPSDGGLPGTLVKDAVLTMVTETYPCTVTFQVVVQDPVYKPVNVRAVVHPRPGASGVQAAITNSLREYFRILRVDGTPNPLVDFGQNIRDANGDAVSQIALSDLFNVVRDVAGVRKIDPAAEGFTLNGAHDDLRLEPYDFPTLGTVTLVNGDNPSAPLP